MKRIAISADHSKLLHNKYSALCPAVNVRFKISRKSMMCSRCKNFIGWTIAEIQCNFDIDDKSTYVSVDYYVRNQFAVIEGGPDKKNCLPVVREIS